MVLPPILPRVKFRLVSRCFGRSGQFQPILDGIVISATTGFAFKKKKKILSYNYIVLHLKSNVHISIHT